MRDGFLPPVGLDVAPTVRILLVGDDPAELRAPVDALVGLGYELVRARSPDDGTALLAAGDFAVVVLDVRSGGAVGLDMARRIRRHPRVAETPILFLAPADGAPFPTADAYRLGTTDVLTRPPDPDALRAKVAVFVEFSRQADWVRRLEGQDFDRRLNEAVQARLARLTALRVDVAQALAEGRAPIPAVLQRCAEAVVRHLGAAFARVWTLNQVDNVLELQASAGMYTHLNGPHSRIPVGALKVGLIAEERRPHLTNDVCNDPRISDPDWARREGMVAFAGYPLVVADRQHGVAALFARKPLTGDTLEALGAAADAIAQGIERRRSEAELRESERRFARFMQHLPGLAWIKDADGRYIFANDAAVLAFGSGRSSLYGKTDADVFPVDTAAQFKEHDKRAVAAAAGVQIVETLKHPDGTEHQSLVSKFPIPAAAGRAPLVGGIAIDITDRVRAEEEARFRARLLDTVAQAVIVTDPDGHIIYWNRYAETLYGWSRDEALRANIMDLVVAPDSANRAHEIMDRLREGRSWTGEFSVRRKDGTAFTAFVTDTPVFDDAGRLTAIIGISADVSEQKRVEQGLRLLADASSALAALTDYESTLQTVAGLAVPDFADLCVVDVAEESGRLRRVAVAHPDPARAETVRDLARRYPPAPDTTQGLLRVMRTGRPELLSDVPDSALTAAAWDDDHLRILRGLGLTSIMFVPLRAGGQTLGVVTFAAAESGRHYTAADLAFAEELARRAATALENARLYTEAREAVGRRDAVVEQLGLLAEASGRLTSAPEIPAVLTAVVDLSHRLVSADAYAIWRLRPDGSWDVAAAAGLSEHYVQTFGRAATGPPPSTPIPAEDALALNVSEARRAAFREEGIVSLLACPLRIHGAVTGALTFYFRTRQRFDDLTVRLATALADMAATAIGMAEQYSRASELRFGAESARERLSFLADASVALAASLDPREILDHAAGLAVPRLADWCVVDVVDPDGTIRQAAVAHSDPAAVQLAWDLDRRYPDNPGAPAGVPKVIRTGRPEFFPEVTDAVLSSIARDDEHLQTVRRLGLRSGMIVPLAARGHVVGAISLGTAESGRTFTSDDLTLAEEFARRAAVALDNAQLYQAVREADRRKDEFLATLAHELRNPLAPIRNALEVMRMAGGDVSANLQARDVMGRQLGQMVRLIDDLLDVSRITRGKLTLRRERVELGTVINGAVETSRPAIEAAGHALTVDLPSRSVWLSADPARLSQVFANLLNNAAKFTPPGGRIRLTAAIEDGEAGATKHAGKPAVVIRVGDNGLGIPREALPRLFEMFSQVDGSLERTQGGLGIGLALVKGLVQMHGGTVTAHSDGPGQGSEFVVQLPVATEDVAAATNDPQSMTHAVPSPSTRGRRVLVVDDNRDAADSLTVLLTMLGHDVRTAHDGLAAVAAAREFRPEVVLMDIGMPRLNGYEAARRIRAEPWGRGMILAAVTGWGQEADRRRSKEAGFDHHLVKPVEPAAVRQVLADPGLTTG
ncbi:MAG TPA: GAF domain-containing protein [Gemmataceae bacterium]|nr:GAF domain-containing protein [Gemmataceae bacterium]